MCVCARRTSKLWIELKVVVEASITLWVMFSCYFAWLPLRHVRMWRSGGSGERPFKFSLLLFRFSWFLMHSSSDTVGDTKRYILKSTHCFYKVTRKTRFFWAHWKPGQFAYLSQVFVVVSEILGGFLQSSQGHPIVAFFAPTREVHSRKKKEKKWLLHCVLVSSE